MRWVHIEFSDHTNLLIIAALVVVGVLTGIALFLLKRSAVREGFEDRTDA